MKKSNDKGLKYGEKLKVDKGGEKRTAKADAQVVTCASSASEKGIMHAGTNSNERS